MSHTRNDSAATQQTDKMERLGKDQATANSSTTSTKDVEQGPDQDGFQAEGAGMPRGRGLLSKLKPVHYILFAAAALVVIVVSVVSLFKLRSPAIIILSQEELMQAYEFMDINRKVENATTENNLCNVVLYSTPNKSVISTVAEFIESAEVPQSKTKKAEKERYLEAWNGSKSEYGVVGSYLTYTVV